MSSDFFRQKRDWSKYKDQILGYYLEPYIPKVAKLNKPIWIVDCFAGKGKFGDGEPGSPLIISGLIQKWRSKGIDIQGLYIESNESNYQTLKHTLATRQEYSTCKHGSFEDSLNDLVALAKSNTVFLYLDPYTVKGLVFEDLKAVYDQVHQSGASVEVLMNLNVATFMRWALAALKRRDDLPDISDEEDFLADDPEEPVEVSVLNGIAGGDNWQQLAENDELPFAKKLEHFTENYIEKMASSFGYICAYPVKSKYEHQVPKYMLVYGTRHPDGLELMNDSMCTARHEFLGAQFNSGTLFDLTPSEENPDTSELKTELLRIVGEIGHINRKRLRIMSLSKFFCKFKKSAINKAVTELLKEKKLYSSTGKSRINDSVVLSAAPFEN